MWTDLVAHLHQHGSGKLVKTTRSSVGTSQCHGNKEENENEILYKINFAIDVSLYTVIFQKTIIT